MPRKYDRIIPESYKDALQQENIFDTMAAVRLPLLGLVPICFIYASDRNPASAAVDAVNVYVLSYLRET